MELIIDTSLSLRRLEMSDSADIFTTIDSQREYLGRWLPFVAFTKELADTDRFVESVVNAPKNQSEYIFTMRLSGRFVGIVGFKGTDLMNKKTEIGYWLSKDYQKQGIVTKSVSRLCDFAFNDLGLNRVQIKCAITNFPSKRVPQRLGFRHEGIERDGELLTGNVFTDIEVFSKLKND